MLDIRPLQEKDYVPLSGFLEEETEGLYTADFWQDRFYLWWERNPVPLGNFCPGWLLVEEDAIRGFLGNIPVRYLIKGEEKIVCSGTSWFVQEKYRRQSLRLLDPFIEQNVPLLNSTPSVTAIQIFTGLQFRSLEQDWLKKDAFLIVSVPTFWKFFSSLNKWNRFVSLCVRASGLIFIPFLWLRQFFARIFTRKPDEGYSFEEIDSFDESFAHLWETFQSDKKILAVRNSDTLNWFFFGSPLLRATRKVIRIDHDGRLIGYAAVKTGTKERQGHLHPYMELLDLVLTEESEGAYRTVAVGLMELAKRHGKPVAYIDACLMNGLMAKTFRYMGFIGKKGQSQFLYSGFGEESQDDFYATPLDGDRSYFP